MAALKDRLDFGLNEEVKFISKLNFLLDIDKFDIKASNYRFSSYDFIIQNKITNHKYYLELKTRRCSSIKYPTYFVNSSKIDWYNSVKKKDTSFIIIWSFIVDNQILFKNYQENDEYFTELDNIGNCLVTVFESKNLVVGIEKLVEEFYKK